jgi:hypothetical protein
VILLSLKITGYYKLPNDSMPQLIDFNELFNTSFMRRYTRYRSFEKFLLGGNFHITCQKDFEELSEARMDAFVKKSADFSSWQEMLDFATDKYICTKIYKPKTITPEHK